MKARVRLEREIYSGSGNKCKVIPAGTIGDLLATRTDRVFSPGKTWVNEKRALVKFQGIGWPKDVPYSALTILREAM